MAWTFEDAATSFSRYCSEWDEINRAHGNHLLQDPFFVQLLINYWGQPGLLVGHSKEKGSRGVVLLEQSRRGCWQTFSPSQAPLGLILLEKGDDIQAQVGAILRGLPGYALTLTITNQDPDWTSLKYQPTGTRAIELVPYIETARLLVQGTFENYWKGRGKDLVSNQSRRRRRLAESGVEVGLVIERDPGRVEDCIKEYGRLEESGWKGSVGTAVSATNTQGLFYRDVMEQFCERGEGTIYRLVFDGKTVASQLAIHRQDVLIFLKMAYDENCKQAAPGYLLRESILKEVFAEGGIRVVEFYGKVRDGWTLKWTDDLRGLYHLNCYRHAWLADARSLVKGVQSRLGGPVAHS